MKPQRLLLFITLSWLIGLNVFCQDVITTKNGKEIEAKIEEIGIKEVRYRRYDNLTGPIFVLDKNDIAKIRYANGTTDNYTPVLTEQKPTFTVTDTLKNSTTLDYQKGLNSATLNYKGYKGASTGTFWATFMVGPLAGLIPAITCSNTPPKQDRYMLPLPINSYSSDFLRGYSSQAHLIKRKKVWKNYRVGLVFSLAVTGAVVAYALDPSMKF
jgi:hypothetical protein